MQTSHISLQRQLAVVIALGFLLYAWTPLVILILIFVLLFRGKRKHTPTDVMFRKMVNFQATLALLIIIIELYPQLVWTKSFLQYPVWDMDYIQHTFPRGHVFWRKFVLIFNFVVSAFGVYKLLNGRPFNYPFSIPFLKH
ncbi:uncharacterized protein DUF4870 [Chitinophaga skermanii]|uniref:Uncharacterized protein DUF4870 n=1 Tax=Chitinophaga skermanii TaxID=331697 RepID=A0A327QT31_9BACT|nr:DUF4870 domain-containing protein [Chitinophaga skermanii]RAJ06852.1 uncharacterized protein DUF4870 [Chitinophaga skermanii]